MGHEDCSWPMPKAKQGERERETECDTLFLNPQHVFSKKFGGISTSMGEMSYVSVHATRIRYRNPYGLRRGRHYTRLSLPAVLTQCSLKPGDVDPSLSPDRERESVCVSERKSGGRKTKNQLPMHGQAKSACEMMGSVWLGSVGRMSLIVTHKGLTCFRADAHIQAAEQMLSSNLDIRWPRLQT